MASSIETLWLLNRQGSVWRTCKCSKSQMNSILPNDEGDVHMYCSKRSVLLLLVPAGLNGAHHCLSLHPCTLAENDRLSIQQQFKDCWQPSADLSGQVHTNTHNHWTREADRLISGSGRVPITHTRSSHTSYTSHTHTNGRDKRS